MCRGGFILTELLMALNFCLGGALRKSRRRRGVNIGMDVSSHLENGQTVVIVRMIIIFFALVLAVAIIVVVTICVHSGS